MAVLVVTNTLFLFVWERPFHLHFKGNLWGYGIPGWQLLSFSTWKYIIPLSLIRKISVEKATVMSHLSLAFKILSLTFNSLTVMFLGVAFLMFTLEPFLMFNGLPESGYLFTKIWEALSCYFFKLSAPFSFFSFSDSHN